MVAVRNLFEHENEHELYLVMEEKDQYPNLVLHLQKESDMYKFASFSLPCLSGSWISEGRKASYKVFESVDELTAYIHALDYGLLDEREERE